MSDKKKSFEEELFVAGEELMASVKKLVAEGNVRSIVLWSEGGKKLLEIPLNVGIIASGAALLLAPFLAAIAGIAALAKKVRIQVIKKDEEEDHKDDTNSQAKSQAKS